MSYYVAGLHRPYDYRVLIEAYGYTKRRNFVHADFDAYYAALLAHLERIFDIRLAPDELNFTQKVLWIRFESTVSSLLRITTPWDDSLEDGLLHRKLEESGEPGKVVYEAGKTIANAVRTSEAAHREMLHALFVAIFGECDRVVTSEELQQAGFDDSCEPKIEDYYDYF